MAEAMTPMRAVIVIMIVTLASSSHSLAQMVTCSTSFQGYRIRSPTDFYPLVDLAAANAWAGHDKEAKEAVTQLQKINPGFTVQTWAGVHWTDDPTFKAQYQRIVEGLRKAGVPEGEKNTN